MEFAHTRLRFQTSNLSCLFFRSLGQAVPNLKNFAEGCIAAHKIFQMIDRIPAIDSEDLSGKKLDAVEGNIELRNVSFTYPGRRLPSSRFLQNKNQEK